MDVLGTGTDLGTRSNRPAFDAAASGLSGAAILRRAHALYDLAEEIRSSRPEAARYLERAADLLLEPR